MPVGERRGHTAPDGALHESLLNEVGFDDVFERFAVFTQGACEVVDADGAACEFLHDGRHEAAVDGSHELQNILFTASGLSSTNNILLIMMVLHYYL